MEKTVSVGKYNLNQNHPHVFLYDEKGEKLLRKFWFYPSGAVTYREWDREGKEITEGERPLLPALKSFLTFSG